MIGRTLSHFEITAKLGEGGMGEVYRARDTKLGREVAIKVLPESLARDPDRLSRFEREARVLASLNHRNIAGIHQVEHAEQRHFLVMELAPGESLDRRLARGPLRLDEIRPIAVQIADALESAHEHGVVHRDLKPANVQISESGQVKLLDFGLSKAFETEPESATDLDRSPTMTLHSTQAGMLLGTAAYMSPEQTRGGQVDRRSDIWAFGAVLWEMLTGRKLHDGESISDIVASVLRGEIDWSELPAATPASIRRLLRRCLERDPSKRLQWIGDARLELEEMDDAAVTDVEQAPRDTLRPKWWWRALPWAAVAALSAIAIWTEVLRPEDETAEANAPRTLATTWTLHPPDRGVFVTSAGRPAVSPDGSSIAFLARQGEAKRQLFVRALDSIESVPLESTENAQHPFWSHDGRSLGFFVDGSLRRIDLQDRAVETIAQTGPIYGPASWSRDGTILVSRGEGRLLTRVLPSGELVELLQEGALRDEITSSPFFLPDGSRFLFIIQDVGGGRQQGVYLGDIEAGTGAARSIAAINSAAQITPSGYLVVWREGALRYFRFDFEAGTVTGNLRKLADGVSFSPYDMEPHYSVQDDVLVYLPGETIWPGRLNLFSRNGDELRSIGPLADYYSPRLSPDGTRIAVDITDVDPPGGDIWTFDTRSGAALRVTSNPQNESNPVWSPDGTELVFQRGSQLVRQPATGVGEAIILVDDSLTSEPCDWSPDGRFILYTLGSGYEKDIWVLDLETAEKKPVLPTSEFAEDGARFSPDGKWVAYFSNETGQNEIYVVDWPELRQKHAVSLGDGSVPIWVDEGREIVFYSQERGVMSVAVRPGDSFEASAPTLLFTADVKMWEQEAEFDAAPDGRRFVIAQAVETTSDGPLIVRTGWKSRLGE